jgi:hypothetical protein
MGGEVSDYDSSNRPGKIPIARMSLNGRINAPHVEVPFAPGTFWAYRLTGSYPASTEGLVL